MRRVEALGLVFLLALALAHSVILYGAPFEDAFITYRYAENAAKGLGLVYNAGERVEGFTSFLWTVLLAGAARAGLPIVGLSRVLSVTFGLSLVASASLLHRAFCVDRDQDARGVPSLMSLAPAAIVAANGTVAYYASTGMETTLFATAVSAGALLAARPPSHESRWEYAAGVVFALASMIRPEGVGFAALVLLALALGRDGRSAALRVGATFALPFVPYFVFRYRYFGHLLPNTYYAKAQPSWQLFRAGLAYAEAYLTTHAFWLAPIACVWLLARDGWARKWRVATAIVFGTIANVIFVGGDTFALYRFFLPAIPLGAVVSVIVLARWVDLRWPLVAARATPAALATMILLVFSVQFLPTRSLLVRRDPSEHARIKGVAAINADYFEVGAWLRDNAPRDAVLATNAAGIVPYVSGLRTIDMLGLNDVHIAHRDIELGRGVSGHEKHDAAYVLSRSPDIILLGLPVLARRPLRPAELPGWVGRWFDALPGDRALYESAEFRARYAPVGVRVGDKHLVLFLRKQ